MRALSLMNSASREPQSWSIASLTVREVVSGPGVSSQESRRGSVMAMLLVLAFDPKITGIVRRLEAAARGESVARDLDLEARLREIRRVHACGAPDVAHGNCTAERVAVGGRAGGAHDAPVAPDRLPRPPPPRCGGG